MAVYRKNYLFVVNGYSYGPRNGWQTLLYFECYFFLLPSSWIKLNRFSLCWICYVFLFVRQHFQKERTVWWPPLGVWWTPLSVGSTPLAPTALKQLLNQSVYVQLQTVMSPVWACNNYSRPGPVLQRSWGLPLTGKWNECEGVRFSPVLLYSSSKIGV